MLRATWTILKETYNHWSEDNASRLGAALAYYTVFSIGPLLVISITIAGLAFGKEMATGYVNSLLHQLVGPEGAGAIQSMMQAAQSRHRGAAALAVGIALLLLGASGVFGELQSALNTIWGVKPKPGLGIRDYIRQRFLSFAMVLGTGFLLLVSLVITTALTALASAVGRALPVIAAAMPIAGIVLSLIVSTVLFALIFKVLPDAHAAWKDVFIGATATAVLFEIGRFALAWYLGRGSFSSYGVAGSILIVFVWVYYAAQILFMGAEFTQVWANRYGSRVRPAEHAIAVGPPTAQPAAEPKQHAAGEQRPQEKTPDQRFRERRERQRRRA